MRRTQNHLAALAFLGASCTQQFDLGLKKFAKPQELIEFDEYNVQVSSRKVDLLFVIDNSGSMENEIATVRDSFSDFISSFVNQQLDYNIGVTTTDLSRSSVCVEGNCYQNAAAYTTNGFANIGPGSLLAYRNQNRVLSSSSMAAADIIASFKDNVGQSTQGSGGEGGLAAAIEATKPTMLSGFNQGFVRPDARLNVIIVSDEDESYGYNVNASNPCPFAVVGSGGTEQPCSSIDYLRDDVLKLAAAERISQFRNHIDQLKGASRPDLFRLDVVSGDPSNTGPCTAATKGITLKQAVESFGPSAGRLIDLCDGNFAPELASLGADLSTQIERRFKLKFQPANTETLSVQIDDREISKSNGTTDGYQYSPEFNTIELIGLNLDKKLNFKVRIYYQRSPASAEQSSSAALRAPSGPAN